MLHWGHKATLEHVIYTILVPDRIWNKLGVLSRAVRMHMGTIPWHPNYCVLCKCRNPRTCHKSYEREKGALLNTLCKICNTCDESNRDESALSNNFCEFLLGLCVCRHFECVVCSTACTACIGDTLVQIVLGKIANHHSISRGWQRRCAWCAVHRTPAPFRDVLLSCARPKAPKRHGVWLSALL